MRTGRYLGNLFVAWLWLDLLAGTGCLNLAKSGLAAHSPLSNRLDKTWDKHGVYLLAITSTTTTTRPQTPVTGNRNSSGQQRATSRQLNELTRMNRCPSRLSNYCQNQGECLLVLRKTSKLYKQTPSCRCSHQLTFGGLAIRNYHDKRCGQVIYSLTTRGLLLLAMLVSSCLLLALFRKRLMNRCSKDESCYSLESRPGSFRFDQHVETESKLANRWTKLVPAPLRSSWNHLFKRRSKHGRVKRRVLFKSFLFGKRSTRSAKRTNYQLGNLYANHRKLSMLNEMMKSFQTMVTGTEKRDDLELFLKDNFTFSFSEHTCLRQKRTKSNFASNTALFY